MEMDPFHDETIVTAGNMILLTGMNHADDIHIVKHPEADQLLLPSEIADIVRFFQAAFLRRTRNQRDVSGKRFADFRPCERVCRPRKHDDLSIMSAGVCCAVCRIRFRVFLHHQRVKFPEKRCAGAFPPGINVRADSRDCQMLPDRQFQ